MNDQTSPRVDMPDHHHSPAPHAGPGPGPEPVRAANLKGRHPLPAHTPAGTPTRTPTHASHAADASPTPPAGPPARPAFYQSPSYTPSSPCFSSDSFPSPPSSPRPSFPIWFSSSSLPVWFSPSSSPSSPPPLPAALHGLKEIAAAALELGGRWRKRRVEEMEVGEGERMGEEERLARRQRGGYSPGERSRLGLVGAREVKVR